MQLAGDFPNLRDAIFRQLASRLPANPDLTKLDPVLLLALVDQGRQAIVGAGPLHPADSARLREAIDAAREILSRLSNKSFPRPDAVEASFLLGVFRNIWATKSGRSIRCWIISNDLAPIPALMQVWRWNAPDH